MADQDIKPHNVLDKKPVLSNTIKLLLVDDEKGFVDVVTKRLKIRNIDVTNAYSGTEAIQKLRKNDFDVVILDLKMEDMGGIEVLKTLKKMDPAISVLMLTGHGSDQAARDGITHGAIDYLTKPCDFKTLLKKIYGAYNNKKQDIIKT